MSAARYISANGGGSQLADERSIRLKRELREHIRLLQDSEPLSQAWMRMADSLYQISNVAFIESIPELQQQNNQHDYMMQTKSNDSLHQFSKSFIQQQSSKQNASLHVEAGKKIQGTLWDQRHDEIAVRILLEEGKLNLLLRVLYRYKHEMQTKGKLIWDEEVHRASKKLDIFPTYIEQKCMMLEAAAGILLGFALNHIEALQIIDLSILIQHIGEQLIVASTNTITGDLDERMQTAQIIYYLASIGRFLEEIDEDRVFALIESHGILTSLSQLLYSHYTWYSPPVLKAAAHFFSDVFSSEAYRMESDRYLTVDAKKQLLSLKGMFVSKLIASEHLKRRDILPLLDEIAIFERKYGAP